MADLADVTGAAEVLRFSQVWPAPTVTLIVCVIGLVLLIATRKNVAAKVIASTPLDLAYVIIMGVAGVVGALMLDVIDMSEVLKGRFTDQFYWQGTILILCTCLGIASLFFQFYKDLAVKSSLVRAEHLDRIIHDHRRRTREIGKIVGQKALRVRKVVRTHQANGEKKMSTSKLLNALLPGEQLSLNFVGLFECLRDFVDTAHSLRLALYLPAPDGSRLELRLSFDGRHPDVITSPLSQHAGRFCLKNGWQKGCLATYAAMRGGMHVISDTSRLTPEQAEIFSFFDDRQRERIKSIVAFAYEVDDHRPFPVLVADSDLPAAFADSDACTLELLRTNFQEFASRLLLEAELLTLLNLSLSRSRGS